MPKAWARRATFLPIVPRPMMPSTLLRTSWTVGGALPCQRPAGTLRRWEIGPVVARAEALHQLQVRRVLVELLRHILLHEAHEIVRAGQGGLLFRGIVQQYV